MMSSRSIDSLTIELINSIIHIINAYTQRNEARVLANEDQRQDDILKIIHCLYEAADRSKLTQNLQDIHFSKSKNWKPFAMVKSLNGYLSAEEMIVKLLKILSHVSCAPGQKSALKLAVEAEIKKFIQIIADRKEVTEKEQLAVRQPTENSKHNTKVANGGNNILSLPSDVITVISRKLNIEALKNLSETCIPMLQKTSNNSIWEAIAVESGIGLQEKRLIKENNLSFRMYCVRKNQAKPECFISSKKSLKTKAYGEGEGFHLIDPLSMLDELLIHPEKVQEHSRILFATPRPGYQIITLHLSISVSKFKKLQQANDIPALLASVVSIYSNCQKIDVKFQNGKLLPLDSPVLVLKKK